MASVLQVSGLVFITTGATWIWPPLGLIVGGALLLLVGLAIEKGK